MREIKVTQDKVCLVDDDVFEELKNFRWCLSNGYAVRRYAKRIGSGHHYIHKHVAQAGPGDVIIHRDGNRLNCTRENLWKTSRKFCQQRVKPRTASGFKGVTLHRGKYTAHIGVAGKTVHLGSYLDRLDAARAYDLEALKVYGEHATLNFSDAASMEMYRASIADNPKPRRTL